MAAESKPRGSWDFIVDALAVLGAREIERRERAAQQQPPGDEAPYDDRSVIAGPHDETQPNEAAA